MKTVPEGDLWQIRFGEVSKLSRVNQNWFDPFMTWRNGGSRDIFSSIRHSQGKKEKSTHRENRSPEGNMWSAIPVTLLCMIVNWSERKQGGGPEGDEVLYNTGGLSFVLPEQVDKML